MRQSLEESKLLWALEKMGQDEIKNEEFNQLMQRVDKLIDYYDVTYEEFRYDLANEFEQIAKGLNDSHEIISTVSTNLINKYKKYGE
jgi:hypothetical protein